MAADSGSFSAERVYDDLKFISKEHHSIEHPVERERVRSYYYDRLSEIGCNPEIIRYDSITLYKGIPVNIANIYCEIPPLTANNDSQKVTNVLLMAHIDSRFANKFRQDTVYSFGAADDGYGCCSILELASVLMKERNLWSQGMKIMLTDSEEVDLDGVKCAMKYNSNIFENVGLVINIDARGSKGPALLFETGLNNEKVYDLYKSAKYPYSYSFTTRLYRYLPNYTDYSPLSETIQGMNFSCLDNVNIYHTDRDNIDNISLYTIQHYGEQIESILKEYLTKPEYSSLKALDGTKDAVAFTVPALGLFTFSKGGYALWNAIALALFCIILCFSIISGRIHAGRPFISALKKFVSAIVVVAFGILVSWIASIASGVDFKLFGIVAGVMQSRLIIICTVVLVSAITLAFYVTGRRNSINRVTANAIRRSASSSGASRYAFESLYGIMIILAIAAAGSYIYIGENFFFTMPVLVAAVAVILWRVTRWRGWLILCCIAIMLHSFSFCYIVSVGLTIGALGAVALLVYLYISLLAPLIDIYARKESVI